MRELKHRQREGSRGGVRLKKEIKKDKDKK
jgi:hypothetical protein